MILEGKKITVGITGGFTAYKAADIIGWLKSAGAQVQVAMTASACQLMSPLMLQVLSGNPVATEVMDSSGRWKASPHIALAECDLYILLPATANILAKAAHGIADEIVSASLVANHAPVLCFPSMNVHMYENPATQSNLQLLQQRGWTVVAQSSGRLVDDAQIETAIMEFFRRSQRLEGKKVIVSAGPTYEFIDSVSFVGTRGSGKMGYAVAEAAAAAGAEVVLVAGPVALSDPHGIRVKHVVSAAEMEAAIAEEYGDADIVIMAAAVADYRPQQAVDHKLKKGLAQRQLDMVLTPDILAGLGRQKGGRLLVGFAAETDNLEQYAKGKLAEKNLDLVLANNVSQEGAGFDVDTNILTAVTADNIEYFPKMSKKAAAEQIIALVAELTDQRDK